jgi:hypothetical protein
MGEGGFFVLEGGFLVLEGGFLVLALVTPLISIEYLLKIDIILTNISQAVLYWLCIGISHALH